MEILISNNQDKISVTEQVVDFIETTVQKTLHREQVNVPVEISVALVDNKEIQLLNKEYRQINRPTDVLSFPLLDDWKAWKSELHDPTMVLGDVVISLEKAEEQAEEYGHSLERELGFLIVHGVLHVLGYDHESEEDQQIMRTREEQILSSLDLVR